MTPARILCILVFLAGCTPPESVHDRPNVILVITDDQGYGDIAAHGHPILQTPHLDRLHDESVRLTDFHVDPTCSPTRSALLTGRYSTRTGVWHTIRGRSLMHPEETTLAEIFLAEGYRTGMVGKWHLGDNYPLRPQDQGFEEVFSHPAGGVGQGPDFFGNDYFDDSYLRNGVLEITEGYVTDVWFDNALAFIDRHQDTPFFLYLSTNAPHSPYFVEDRYAEPYAAQGVNDTMARFMGMVTNIDDNMGRLLNHLDERKLSDNTILIFMTDNGSAEGWANRKGEPGTFEGFDAGMRQGKGSEYDGGHRVPFFIRWPQANIGGGREIATLAAHIDVLPTLADLCRIQSSEKHPLDGKNLAPLLRGDEDNLAERTLFVHSQRVAYPIKWRKSAVMTERWRLVNQVELYDIIADPAQRSDVAVHHTNVVDSLQTAYDTWWNSLAPAFDKVVRIGVGADAENPIHLNPHDWHTADHTGSVWNHRQVTEGMIGNGHWELDVTQAGTYTIELRRWPRHLDDALEAVHARLQIGDMKMEQATRPENTHVTFTATLQKGHTTLQTWLTLPDGTERGAYFVYLERLYSSASKNPK